ncbi:MAG TPA: hypothetical protein VF459_01915 [Caulobacteraceae bacterium]
MRRNSTWSAEAAPADSAKAAKPIACILFVTALGVSFWAGVLWVTLPLLR